MKINKIFLIASVLALGFLFNAAPALAWTNYTPPLPAGYQNVGVVADRLAVNTKNQLMQYNTTNYGYNNTGYNNSMYNSGYGSGCNSNYNPSYNSGSQYNTTYGYNPTYNSYGYNNPNYNVTRPLVIQPMINGQPCGMGTSNPACLYADPGQAANNPATNYRYPCGGGATPCR